MNEKFEYKLTKIFYILFIAGLLLAGYCIFANVVRFIKLLSATEVSITSYVASAMSVLIGVLGFVLIIPAMISSKYEVTNKYLISRWGLIVNKTEVKTITTVTHFRITDKLVVYYNDQTYTVINIESKEYDRFVDALKKANKNIFYSLNTEDYGEK